MSSARLMKALTLAYLACTGHGRRLHISSKQVEHNPRSQGAVDPHHALAAFLLAREPAAAFHRFQGMHRQKNLVRPVLARSFHTVMSEDGTPTEKSLAETSIKDVAVQLYEDKEGEEEDVALSSMTFEQRLEFLASQEVEKSNLTEEEKAAIAPSLLDDDPEDENKDSAGQAEWAFYGLRSIEPLNPQWLWGTWKQLQTAPTKEGTVLWRDSLFIVITFFVVLFVADILDAASNNFWRYIQAGQLPTWSWEYIFKGFERPDY